MTLCEVIWVLERCYDVSKKDIAEIVKQLLHTHQLKIESDDVVKQALRDFQQHPAIDFPDCLIGRQNSANGCSMTYTFDKKAAKALPRLFQRL